MGFFMALGTSGHDVMLWEHPGVGTAPGSRPTWGPGRAGQAGATPGNFGGAGSFLLGESRPQPPRAEELPGTRGRFREVKQGPGKHPNSPRPRKPGHAHPWAGQGGATAGAADGSGILLGGLLQRGVPKGPAPPKATSPGRCRPRAQGTEGTAGSCAL